MAVNEEMGDERRGQGKSRRGEARRDEQHGGECHHVGQMVYSSTVSFTDATFALVCSDDVVYVLQYQQ